MDEQLISGGRDDGSAALRAARYAAVTGLVIGLLLGTFVTFAYTSLAEAFGSPLPAGAAVGLWFTAVTIPGALVFVACLGTFALLRVFHAPRWAPGASAFLGPLVLVVALVGWSALR